MPIPLISMQEMRAVLLQERLSRLEIEEAERRAMKVSREIELKRGRWFFSANGQVFENFGCASEKYHGHISAIRKGDPKGEEILRVWALLIGEGKCLDGLVQQKKPLL